jgi:hypothetical protein
MMAFQSDREVQWIVLIGRGIGSREEETYRSRVGISKTIKDPFGHSSIVADEVGVASLERAVPNRR